MGCSYGNHRVTRPPTQKKNNATYGESKLDGRKMGLGWHGREHKETEGDINAMRLTLTDVSGERFSCRITHIRAASVRLKARVASQKLDRALGQIKAVPAAVTKQQQATRSSSFGV
mgnify:CR=1 FL=1